MKPTPLFRPNPSREPASAALHTQQRSTHVHRTEAMVIESPADQSWIAFCATLAAPVMLLPDMDWNEG